MRSPTFLGRMYLIVVHWWGFSYIESCHWILGSLSLSLFFSSVQWPLCKVHHTLVLLKGPSRWPEHMKSAAVVDLWYCLVCKHIVMITTASLGRSRYLHIYLDVFIRHTSGSVCSLKSNQELKLPWVSFMCPPCPTNSWLVGSLMPCHYGALYL